MVIVADSIPGLKRWLAPLGLKDSTRLLVIRVIAAFLFHPGRMSCLRAVPQSVASRGIGLRSAASCAAAMAQARH